MSIFIYTILKKQIMKPEYKMRAQEHLEAITKRAKVIAEMLKGERPADQAQAARSTDARAIPWQRGGRRRWWSDSSQPRGATPRR